MLLSECLRSWPSVPFILVLLLSSLISSLTKNRGCACASDFGVNQPGSSTSWKNGSPYPVTWDITRLSRGGIYFVAKALPITMSSLNVVLQDVPAGDDYFLICMNATVGRTYSVSSRFSVTDANATGSNPMAHPGPLSAFAQTFGPATNGVARPGWPGIRNQLPLIGGFMVLC
ncbi:hypothetical protein EDD22DRAFT_982791 [Suillus occidentalis]|nr:hypothetical protein EDD22DRAFT_982791 [Suillus occidentalis]